MTLIPGTTVRINNPGSTLHGLTGTVLPSDIRPDMDTERLTLVLIPGRLSGHQDKSWSIANGHLDVLTVPTPPDVVQRFTVTTTRPGTKFPEFGADQVRTVLRVYLSKEIAVEVTPA